MKEGSAEIKAMLPQGKYLTKVELDSVCREVMTTSGYDDVWNTSPGYESFVLKYGFCGSFLKLYPKKSEELVVTNYLYQSVQREYNFDMRRPPYQLVLVVQEKEEQYRRSAFEELKDIVSPEKMQGLIHGWNAFLDKSNTLAKAFFDLSLPQKLNLPSEAFIDEAQSGTTVTTTVDKSMAGRPTDTLFIDCKDMDATVSRESRRLQDYFFDNEIDLSLNCSLNHLPNQIVAAFVKEWKKRKMVPKQPSARALTRFLIYDCGADCKLSDPERTYSRFIKNFIEKELPEDLCTKVQNTFV